MCAYIYCGTDPPVGADRTRELLIGEFHAIWCPRLRMNFDPEAGAPLWLIWQDADGGNLLLLGGGRLVANNDRILWTVAGVPGVREAEGGLGHEGPTNSSFLDLAIVIAWNLHVVY